MKRTSLVVLAIIFAHLVSRAEEVSISAILPSGADLGPGWTSNRVVVLLDPLSSPTVITNEGPDWLRAAQHVVGTNGCKAYAVLRCFRTGGGSALVWIHRYQSPNAIGDDWGRDQETKTAPKDLPQVGDEVRFYQRHGRHNNLAFRRGCYLIDVEGGGTSTAAVKHLAQLAQVMDSMLIKAGGGGR